MVRRDRRGAAMEPSLRVPGRAAGRIRPHGRSNPVARSPGSSAVSSYSDSALQPRAADFGIEIVGPMPYYRFIYPVPPPSLSNLVYDFQHRYRYGRDPSSYTQRMKEATDRWRESAASGLTSLSYRRGPGFLIVNDRRPGLEEADYEFEDVEAKIYLACDAGATVERIRSLLLVEDDGAPETDEIQEFVDDLVSARLMYREGNSYLSL